MTTRRPVWRTPASAIARLSARRLRPNRGLGFSVPAPGGRSADTDGRYLPSVFHKPNPSVVLYMKREDAGWSLFTPFYEPSRPWKNRVSLLLATQGPFGRCGRLGHYLHLAPTGT
jgi:hypothetical protein